MKPKKKWHRGLIELLWLTRSEAADYLRWNVKTLDRNLVPATHGRTPGKIRYEVQTTDTVRKIRLLAEDVYAICPVNLDPNSLSILHLVNEHHEVAG